MTQALPTIDVVQSQPYALLSLDDHTLLLPQGDISSLEPVLDVITDEPPPHGVGWLRFEGVGWPVYCLDAELKPLPDIPHLYRICIVLHDHERYFGLTCANVAMLPGAAVRAQLVPEAMSRPKSPLCGLALYEGTVRLVSTAAALAAFLEVSRLQDLQKENAIIVERNGSK